MDAVSRSVKSSRGALALLGLGLAAGLVGLAGVVAAAPADPSASPAPTGQSGFRALKGIVSSVDGERLTIDMEGDLLPMAGDVLEIQRDFNGVAFSEISGTWVVSEIEDGRVIARTVDPDSDPVQVGDLVTILTDSVDSRLQPTEDVTPGGPAVTPTDGPTVLRGPVVAIRDRTALVDIEGSLLPRPGDPVEFFETRVDDIPPVLIVGNWTIESVVDGRITVTSEGFAAWDELHVGNLAEIRSADPVERPDVSGDGPVGSIGVRPRPIWSEQARRLGDEELPAATLSLSRSPELRAMAEAAGLRNGDIVVAVDGQGIGGPYDLDRRIRRTRPGTTLTLDIVRLHPDRVERLEIVVRVAAIGGGDSGR